MLARIGFGLAIGASLGFGGWFLFSESNSPGISFAVAFIGMHLLLAGFGFFKVQEGGVTKEGKGAGWAAIVVAALGVGYFGVSFTAWLVIAVCWFATNLPMLIGILTSKTVQP